VFGDKVPEPVSVKVTQWASDEFSRGSYSYVAVGCTGAEYDTLALPVSRCVLFAGEHTCKEHPDSVGGEPGLNPGLITHRVSFCLQRGHAQGPRTWKLLRLPIPPSSLYLL